MFVILRMIPQFLPNSGIGTRAFGDSFPTAELLVGAN